MQAVIRTYTNASDHHLSNPKRTKFRNMDSERRFFFRKLSSEGHDCNDWEDVTMKSAEGLLVLMCSKWFKSKCPQLTFEGYRYELGLISQRFCFDAWIEFTNCRAICSGRLIEFKVSLKRRQKLNAFDLWYAFNTERVLIRLLTEKHIHLCKLKSFLLWKERYQQNEKGARNRIAQWVELLINYGLTLQVSLQVECGIFLPS